MIYFGLIALLAALDQCVKSVIEKQEDNTFPRPLPCCKKYITVQKFHNDGLPFGFLKEKQDLVKNIPAGIATSLLGVLLWLLPMKGHRLEKTAASITLGGAASNLYDRYTRDYVVDYFSVNAGFLKRIIFNLGDLFVFAGSLMLMGIQLFDLYGSGRTKKKAPAQKRKTLTKKQVVR